MSERDILAVCGRSYSEEWARRELIRQDVRRDSAALEARLRRERDARFRERHPWLARLWYGPPNG